MSEQPMPPRGLWWLGAGFAVWCSALVLLYAVHAIGCAFAWPTGSLRLSLVVGLAAHLLALGWMWRHIARNDTFRAWAGGAFLQRVVVWTLMAALAATLVTLAPPLLLSTCI
jgi:hypothetical protein